MGSTSSGDPAAASLSADSLHGLKFGKKIYFEDAGGSAGAHTSSSSSSSSGAKKSRGAGQGCVQQQQQQPPRCQVEGCGEDLSGEKAYYCRHKVCVMHSKFPKVVVAGLEQRFCQQCSRFHQLPEFDQGKRSCRRRLAGHNERRRKPPPLSLPLQYGQFTSTFHDDRSRYGGLMMDFTHPVPQGAGRHTWPLIRSGEHVTVAQLPITTGGVTPPGRLSITQSRSFACSSAAGTLFSGHDIPPDGYIGTSQHSSCALSLLSTQSWGTPQLTVRAPVVQQSHFESNPMAQPTIPTSLHSNAWGLGRQEAYGAAHEASPHTSMARATQQVFSRRQFPGELELALQGSGQSADQVHEHEFFQPGNEMHWSL